MSNKKNTVGRPRIEGRKMLKLNKYESSLRLRNIRTRVKLAEKMSENCDRTIPADTIRTWERDGWPPEMYTLLLLTIGMSRPEAETEMA